MNTTHRTYRHQSLATGVGLIVTLALALTASDAPRADAIIAPSMAAALQDMNGTNGWLLKKGNTVLSSKNADFVFEPASAIKFIIHLKAELMMQSNWVSPSTPILRDQRLQRELPGRLEQQLDRAARGRHVQDDVGL